MKTLTRTYQIVCLFAGIFLFKSTLFAQTKGAIEGWIIEENTGNPLYGANIMAKGTLLGNSSDTGGYFNIQNLPTGPHLLQITMIGYEKQSVPVSIRPDATAQVTVHLAPTVLKQPTLVVTATKRKQHIEDAPTTVDVIQSEYILKRNPATLDEVLVNTPGLGIIEGQIELRGSTGFNYAAGSRVLLMIDGHPMINGDTGGINWDAIPVEEVDHVEIVKGAGSALYGGNAMSGMVNIITRTPRITPQLRYRLHWGFYDEPAYGNWLWTDRFLTRQISENNIDLQHALTYEGVDVSYSQQIRDVGILATLGRKTSRGYHENGDYTLWNAFLKTVIHFTPQKKWILMGNLAFNDHGEFIQWESQSAPMTVPDSEYGNRIDYRKGGLMSTFKHAINHRFAYTVKSNWYRTDWKNNFPGMPDYAVTDKIGSEIQVDLLKGNHGFTLGTEGIYTITDARIFGQESSWDAAIYAEDQIKFSPLWTLTAGARLDVHRIPDVSFDWQISPRAGLVFRPQSGTSVRMSMGRGFRAPSLAEVFSEVYVSGMRVVPNLELKKAEKAISAEIGINQMFQTTSHEQLYGLQPKFIVDVALFANWYDNMIDVGKNSNLHAYQFMDMGRAEIYGLESKIKASLWDGLFIINSGWTWLDHRDLDGWGLLDKDKLNPGEPLPYRSNHRVTAGGEIVLNRLSFGLDYRYASVHKKVIIFPNDQRVPMHVVDARIQYNFGKLNLSIDCKNLRNYHYTLRQRLLEPIRHYVITLRGNI
ncbi:TonB-dependent receptor [bacterium]|nr:TonB-dependent receptor [bacterium]